MMANRKLEHSGRSNAFMDLVQDQIDKLQRKFPHLKPETIRRVYNQNNRHAGQTRTALSAMPQTSDHEAPRNSEAEIRTLLQQNQDNITAMFRALDIGIKNERFTAQEVYKVMQSTHNVSSYVSEEWCNDHPNVSRTQMSNDLEAQVIQLYLRDTNYPALWKTIKNRSQALKAYQLAQAIKNVPHDVLQNLRRKAFGFL